MRFILSLLTWWQTDTLGTRLFTWRKGVRVGEDDRGNVYFRTRDDKRRWVSYAGDVEASKVSADWHGWLHHTFDDCPADNPLPRKSWQIPHQKNLTGTDQAYAPAGSMRQENQADRRDYEAWQPE